MNRMLYLESCLKCGGDMYQANDKYGVYRQCLQCGYAYDPVKASPAALQVDASAPDREGKAA